MSTIAVNGARVVSGSITIPYYGAWSADLVMADPAELATAVTLEVGDLSLVGTVIRQASFAGSRTARIVGGAGGWRTQLPVKGYSHVVGVKLSAVLNDAARAAGETIVIDADRSIGTHFARDAGTGESVLNLLLNGQWWIDTAGVTQTGTRSASVIATPFTVSSWSGAKGQFEIASEAIAAWQPGRTFSTSTVPDAQAISSVTIEATNDGKLRLHVLNADGTTERLRSSLRSLIRAEMSAMNFAGVWEYNVAASAGLGLSATIDCTPTDARMPALTRVPVVGPGVVSPPLAGTTCRIQFVNCDPTRPECVSMGDTTEHLVTVEALSVILHNLIILMGAAALPSAWLVSGVALGLVNGALAATATPAPPGLIAQAAAAITQASAMLSGPGATSAPFTAAIAGALAGKTLDVSGLFPSVGVPNG